MAQYVAALSVNIHMIENNIYSYTKCSKLYLALLHPQDKDPQSRCYFERVMLFPQECCGSNRAINTIIKTESWLDHLITSEHLFAPVPFIYEQFIALAFRIMACRRNNETHLEAYGYSSKSKIFERDLRNLANLVLRLAKASRIYFKTTKKILQNQDIIEKRSHVLQEIFTLNQEIEKIAALQYDSLEKSVKIIEKQTRNLEKYVFKQLR